MPLHLRSVEPQTRQACYGRDQPVNDSDVIERYRQPTTALTVMMALHPHLINPNHHLPRATQKSQRRFWPRAPCRARLCDRLNLRASPLTSHCAGGRRGASSAFAEPLTVQSLASAATLSTAPTRPARPVGPWARGKLVGARERTSRRRPAPPAVSRLMQRDLHPRHPPWPHGWHGAPGPRQDVVGWERLLLFRRRARNAPDQVDERQAGDGRDLAGQLEAALGIVVSAHHRAPQTQSAKCTGNSSHD